MPRAHWQSLVGKHPDALRILTGPEYPDAVEYLVDWLYQLHGRSGVGMNGAAPLAYGTIADWSRLTGTRVTPDDVRALIRLDAVLMGRGADPADPSDEMDHGGHR